MSLGECFGMASELNLIKYLEWNAWKKAVQRRSLQKCYISGAFFASMREIKSLNQIVFIPEDFLLNTEGCMTSKMCFYKLVVMHMHMFMQPGCCCCCYRFFLFLFFFYIHQSVHRPSQIFSDITAWLISRNICLKFKNE